MNVHDFADTGLGKAVPYGVYEVTASTGWMNVGTDAAPASSRWNRSAAGGTRPARWGRHAARLLITADPGGSNGSPQEYPLLVLAEA